MIKSGFTPRLLAIGQKIQSLARFNWLLSLVIAVIVTVAATPPPDQQTPDEQYIHIMALIDRGDALRAAGQMDAAKGKYKEARRELLYFKAVNPLFAPKTVTYRLNELSERIDTRLPVTETKPSAEKPKLEAESAASKSHVKLIDAGAEPRQVLRMHAVPGDKQTAAMTIKLSMEMPMPPGGTPGAAAPGGAAPAGTIKIPAITILIDFTVQNIAANGDVSYQAVAEEASVAEEPGAQPQMAQAMKAAMAGFKGIIGDGVRSSRNISKKVEVKTPPGAGPQIVQAVDQVKQIMSNMGLPLPEEAVGPGAKWEVKMPVNSGGINIEQTAIYEAVSIAGDQVKTTFTLNQSAADQKIQLPAMAGAQVHLVQLTGSGKGSATDDLSKLASSQAVFDVHTDINAEVNAAGKKTPVTMKMDMSATVEAK
jgi:hypothetical protein